MAVTTGASTVGGGVTPMCNSCGVSLCWDISRTEYLEARVFWDEWCCRDCAPAPLSAYGWRLQNGREALPAEVEAVVAAFDLAHPELSDDGNGSDPRAVCVGFAAALSAAGIASDIGIAGDVRGKPHPAVAVGDFTIDWTALRHDVDAPTPLVYRTTLGWPIVPETMSQLLQGLSEMDPDAFQALLAKAIARKAAKDAAVA